MKLIDEPRVNRPTHPGKEAKATLQVRVLGSFAVLRDQTRLPLPRSKKTRALLAYLAVTDRAHSRDRLCAMFWPVPDDPRAALRWSLSRLRPLVDPDSPHKSDPSVNVTSPNMKNRLRPYRSPRAPPVSMNEAKVSV